ncbi:MAG TPA: ferredoxin family protein [Pyrinomonadaceae bacterium]|nr:ferredoxin family protein [Pyrinomonadaceae bacterium]
MINRRKFLKVAGTVALTPLSILPLADDANGQTTTPTPTSTPTQIDPGDIYIIAEPCIGTKDTACVDVCPVDAIHFRPDEDGFAGAEMLYINPAACIACGKCEPACPPQAIFQIKIVPEHWQPYIEMNRKFYEKEPKT